MRRSAWVGYVRASTSPRAPRRCSPHDPYRPSSPTSAITQAAGIRCVNWSPAAWLMASSSSPDGIGWPSATPRWRRSPLTGPPLRPSAALVHWRRRCSPHGSRSASGVHPDRVDSLVGRRVVVELSALSLAGCATVSVALTVIVVTVSGTAGHASMGLPTLVAQACMIAMAALPPALGAALLIISRRGFARWSRGDDRVAGHHTSAQRA